MSQHTKGLCIYGSSVLPSRDENDRNHIVIRSTDGQTVIQNIPALSDAAIMGLMLSPDNHMLVWMDSPVLRFWDIASKRLLKTYVAPCQ